MISDTDSTCDASPCVRLNAALLVNPQVALGQTSRAREDELAERAAVVFTTRRRRILNGCCCWSLFVLLFFFLRCSAFFYFRKDAWRAECLPPGSLLVFGRFCIRCAARICYRLLLKTQSCFLGLL